jgi:hypothetical protein
MTISLCKHSFPCQPPHGSIFRPGDCTGCGITYNALQAELRKQEQAYIIGTSRDGACPDCHKDRRLFRWQPQEQPWHEIGVELPVTFVCIDCWNAATTADNALAAALFEEAAS